MLYRSQQILLNHFSDELNRRSEDYNYCSDRKSDIDYKIKKIERETAAALAAAEEAERRAAQAEGRASDAEKKAEEAERKAKQNQF